MQSEPLIDFQPPSNTAIAIVLLSMSSLFFLAVAVEVMRRRRLKRMRDAHEWRSLREVIKEKDLSREEATLLEAMAKRWNPDAPLRIATVRRVFNDCVNKEMDRIAEETNSSKFAVTGARLRDIRQRLSHDFVPLGQRIQSTRELYTAQLINVGRDSEERTKFVPFTIAEIDEAYLVLRPLADGMHPPDSYRDGQALPCRLWREEDARYTFALPFAGLRTDDKLWRFRHTHALVRHQAREHFRVSYNEMVDVDVLDAPLDGDYSDVVAKPRATHLRGRITSLSAGGLAMQLDQGVARQVLLRAKLGLEGYGPATVVGTIVGLHTEPGGRYIVRCRFVELDDETRETIAHYITIRQNPAAAETGEETIE